MTPHCFRSLPRSRNSSTLIARSAFWLLFGNGVYDLSEKPFKNTVLALWPSVSTHYVSSGR